MTTLVKAGRFRCDATCHNARGKRCGCICGGRLHGQGERAISLLAGLEPVLPAGIKSAAIKLPAPGGFMPRYDHHVTLTVRWNGPPDEVELVGAGLVLAAGDHVASLMSRDGARVVDVRVAPWIATPEFALQHIEDAIREDNWSGRVLQLAAKSDAAHLEALRAIVPDLIEAWEAWREGPHPGGIAQ